MTFMKKALDAEDQSSIYLGSNSRSAAYGPTLWLLCDCISSMSHTSLLLAPSQSTEREE